MDVKYDYIIFDLDGVLCHTDNYHYIAWKKICDKLNLRFDETMNNKLRGVSRKDSFLIILSENAKKEENYNIEEILKIKNDIYISLLENLTYKSNEKSLITSLDTLKTNGIKMAVASSSKNAKKILSKLEISEYFSVVVDGNDISKSKPDPEIFYKALNKLGVKNKKNVIIVEDSEAGIYAAKSLGVDSIGLNIKNSNLAKYKIDRFEEICKIIL